MTSNPTVKVSIIIPAYNCGFFLEEALDSVLQQNIKSIEIIAIDDGSTDNTLSIVKKYASVDDRIRIFTQANSGGPANPRNFGISVSNGKYICFLDPDDYWFPGKLAKQLLAFETHPEAGLAFSDMDLVDFAGKFTGETYLGRVNYLKKAQSSLLAIGDNSYLSSDGFYAFSSVEILGIQTSGVMLRKSAIEKFDTWFATDLAVGEDSDFWFRILELYPAIFINESLYAYRQHDSSLMCNSEKVAMGSLMVHERNYMRSFRYLNKHQVKKFKERIGKYYFALGYYYWTQLDLSQSRKILMSSLSWKLSTKTVLLIMKTLLPRRLVLFLKSKVS